MDMVCVYLDLLRCLFVFLHAANVMQCKMAVMRGEYLQYLSCFYSFNLECFINVNVLILLQWASSNCQVIVFSCSFYLLHGETSVAICQTSTVRWIDFLVVLLLVYDVLWLWFSTNRKEGRIHECLQSPWTHDMINWVCAVHDVLSCCMRETLLYVKNLNTFSVALCVCVVAVDDDTHS